MALTQAQQQEVEKLRELFKTRPHAPLKEIAEKYELGTPANLSHYMNGRRPLNLKIALIMSKELKVEVFEFSDRLAVELDHLTNCINKNSKGTIWLKIPVFLMDSPLPLVQGNISEPLIKSENFVLFEFDEKELNKRKDIFAIVAQDESMSPQFNLNDLLILVRNKEPKPGDFVLAKHESKLNPYKSEWLLRKYRLLGVNEKGEQAFELSPLNCDYPIINSVREKCEIIAVLVEHRQRF